MKLYHFPSPNPQKVHLATLELGLECELVPVDLTKGEQRKPEFLALNPCGRVPVLTDGDITVSDSHAILAYLGDKTGKLWPTSTAGRAGAFQWLFFLSAHVSPPVSDLAFNRIAAKLLGLTPDEGAIARGEQAMPAVIGILEGHLGKNKWMLGDDFSLVDCAYGPVLNALEKARFSYADFPRVQTYRRFPLASVMAGNPPPPRPLAALTLHRSLEIRAADATDRVRPLEIRHDTTARMQQSLLRE